MTLIALIGTMAQAANLQTDAAHGTLHCEHGDTMTNIMFGNEMTCVHGHWVWCDRQTEMKLHQIIDSNQTTKDRRKCVFYTEILEHSHVLVCFLRHSIPHVFFDPFTDFIFQSAQLFFLFTPDQSASILVMVPLAFPIKLIHCSQQFN